MKSEIIATVPIINVPRLNSLYPVFTFMQVNCVTTQKKLSFTCEITIEPAPTAITTIALSHSLVKPSEIISGANTEAAVIIATVEDPCAVFSTADNKKGRNNPSDEWASASPSSPAASACCNTFPNTPPAAVMNRIDAALSNALPVHQSAANIFLSIRSGNNKQQAKPISSAINGSPANRKKFFKIDCQPSSFLK